MVTRRIKFTTEDWEGDCSIEEIKRVYSIQYSERYGIEFIDTYQTDGSKATIGIEELNEIRKINTDVIDYDILKAIDWEENYETNVEEMIKRLINS